MMFAVFRAGIHIPVPGVDASVIESLFTSGNLFGLLDLFAGGARSEERRVGKECRSRWSPYH